MQAIFFGGFQADQNLDFAGINRVFFELPIKAVIVAQRPLKQQYFRDFIGTETQRWRGCGVTTNVQISEAQK
jgi:hypothetical protein